MFKLRKFYNADNKEITSAKFYPISNFAVINGKIKKSEDLTAQERSAIKYFEQKNKQLDQQAEIARKNIKNKLYGVRSPEVQEMAENMTDEEFAQGIIDYIRDKISKESAGNK